VRAQAEIVRQWGAEKKNERGGMGGRKTSGIKKLYDLTLHQIKSR
jgi:hypothetical protein